eukprot:TRINITY_DN3459_c1_g1_i2.p1 TRINITY_DN3459_c1_g1~~TRINITY_DN3459_c1_g1_i2.p1  ORF type:complete len:112 (+),score=7.91 TRINITY_DN3459_c1_g1_i2:4149-4484(+)
MILGPTIEKKKKEQTWSGAKSRDTQSIQTYIHQWSQLFLNFWISARNQVLKFDPIAVIGLWKRINDLDLDLEGHRIQKLIPSGSCLFTNILRSVMNQWFRFDSLAMFDLMK